MCKFKPIQTGQEHAAHSPQKATRRESLEVLQVLLDQPRVDSPRRSPCSFFPPLRPLTVSLAGGDAVIHRWDLQHGVEAMNVWPWAEASGSRRLRIRMLL